MSAETDLAHDGIVPDEVRRLRVNPDETLIVRVRDFTPRQIHEYRQWLEAVLPGMPILVVLGDEILTVASDQDASSEVAGAVTVGFMPIGDFANFATLEIRDAHTGESFVGVTEAHLDAHPKRGITIRLTEILGESGHPIREHNAREKMAPPNGENIPTITRTFLVAPRRLEGDGDD